MNIAQRMIKKAIETGEKQTLSEEERKQFLRELRQLSKESIKEIQDSRKQTMNLHNIIVD